MTNVPTNYPMNGATVLVTGGAGLIGSHIVDGLVKAGAKEIRVLDNFVRGNRSNLADALTSGLVTLIEADVRDRNAVVEAVSGCDYVFHQAALRITLCAEQPREAMDVLIGGTFNVFEAAVTANVRKVVYASSASVYGAAEEFPTTERHHGYNNRTFYGACKMMNEGIARSFNEMYGLPSVGLRYFNVYGQRMDVTGVYTEVFVRWLDCIEQRKSPIMHGDGSATMDFIHVEDIARANLLAMQSAQTDAVYNVANGTETSLLGLWQAMQRITGAHDLAPEFHPVRKVNPVPRRLADTFAAERDLGFQAEIGLDEGLRRLSVWRSSLVETRQETRDQRQEKGIAVVRDSVGAAHIAPEAFTR